MKYDPGCRGSGIKGEGEGKKWEGEGRQKGGEGERRRGGEKGNEKEKETPLYPLKYRPRPPLTCCHKLSLLSKFYPCRPPAFPTTSKLSKFKDKIMKITLDVWKMQ